MKLLKTIREKDVFGRAKTKKITRYKTLKSGRAVVLDNRGKIALLNVSKRKYHKLPGGGRKKNESIIQSLKRECLEEIGCQIIIKKEIGKIIEYRNWETPLKHTSFCYLAKIKGKKGKSRFTSRELKQKFKVNWLSLDRAIRIIKKDKPIDYYGKFIKLRELTYLKKAKEILSL